MQSVFSSPFAVVGKEMLPHMLMWNSQEICINVVFTQLTPSPLNRHRVV